MRIDGLDNIFNRHVNVFRLLIVKLGSISVNLLKCAHFFIAIRRSHSFIYLHCCFYIVLHDHYICFRRFFGSCKKFGMIQDNVFGNEHRFFRCVFVKYFGFMSLVLHRILREINSHRSFENPPQIRSIVSSKLFNKSSCLTKMLMIHLCRHRFCQVF